MFCACTVQSDSKWPRVALELWDVANASEVPHFKSYLSLVNLNLKLQTCVVSHERIGHQFEEPFPWASPGAVVASWGKPGAPFFPLSFLSLFILRERERERQNPSCQPGARCRVPTHNPEIMT